jgi:hypothetical protein
MMASRLRPPVLALATLGALSWPAAGQPARTAPPGAQGARATLVPASSKIVTATRLVQPLDLDGRLDDEVYRQTAPTTGFVQQEPREGEEPTEKTEVWVLFDDRNLYVAARLSDSQPEREIATEMRRDNSNIVQNENFAVLLDTFHDMRNGFQFQTNRLGAYRDSTVVDAVASDSWNTVWEVRTARFEGGWTVEMEVPFKSLRYPNAGPQTWGVQMRRIIKWKNEFDYLTPLPAALGLNAFSHLELAATLVGLETPAQSKNLELKPYIVSSLTTDQASASPFTNKRDGNVGFDFKYGLTRGLVADATVNTDFAQIEEDQQQVNLTRFSLFFPEKRDFFLEGQGIFAFGGIAFGNSNQGGPGDAPVMFFSRQIGLNKGQSVPVVAGGRLAGRVGKYQIGALNIETADKAEAGAVATNFTAVRLKRDFLRRSTIGIIATRRDPTGSGHGRNLEFGADVNLGFYKTISINAYYARSDTLDRRGGEASYLGRFEYAGDRYGLTGEHLLIEPDFNPELGFVRRVDFRKTEVQARFSPRPTNSRRVRKYSYTAGYNHVTNAAATSVQDRTIEGIFNIDFNNGDAFNVDYTHTYERLPARFVINPGTTVAAGVYTYDNVNLRYTIGQQRPVSGRLSAARGALYDGTKTEAGYTGRIAVRPQFAVEPAIALNWVRLPVGDFEAPVISTRIIFTPNTRTALTSLVQYNGSSHLLSSSIRLRWEYRPGSEIFLVYSDGRDTTTTGYPGLLNRSVALKATRLLRF